jgi:putative glutamine amidotransferase
VKRGEGRILRIGVSARFFRRAPAETGLKDKPLLYLEQSMAHWLMARNVLPLLIPSLGASADLTADRYARGLDGLVLQGGVDISPLVYGETPISPDISGDPIRDAYELQLLHAFMAREKPVLGICRGAQLINVALGGTLFQDIPTQLPGAIPHRDLEDFDRLRHDVLLTPGSGLARLYPGVERLRTNTLHHQAVKRLGRELAVEATAVDGVIEAIRWQGPGYLFGVQWHPEFHPQGEPGLLDGEPILRNFLDAVVSRRVRRGPQPRAVVGE